MIHPKLNAFEIVFGHFGIHLMEMGRGFPTA